MKRRFFTALPWALAFAACTLSVASAGFGPAQGGATGSGGTIVATNVVGGTAHAVAVEQGGVAALAGVGPVASGSLLASAGVSSDPAFVALGKMLDVLGATPGSILYRGTTTNGYQVLTPGSNANVLTLAGGVPTWAAPGSTSLNPTTSIITIGDGLGAVVQLKGPTDQALQIAAGATKALLIGAKNLLGSFASFGTDGSIGINSLNGDIALGDQNSGVAWLVKSALFSTPGTLYGNASTNRISCASGNENDLTTDAANSGKVAVKNTGVTISSAGSVAAVCSVTQELRFGGTIAQPTQQTQAASVTLDTTAGTWNANSAIAQTYTLPDATSCAGRIYKIKQTGAGVLTLATTSSQNIDGSTTYVFPARYVSLEVQSDGAQWWIY